MKRPSTAGIVGVIVAILVVATSYASPYWTLREMRTALIDKDADAFSSHVDFPAVRESVRGQVMIAMQARLGTPEMKGNAFAGLGMLLGMALINQIIDTLVTPGGVMTLMAQGSAQPIDLGNPNAPASPRSGAAIRPGQPAVPPQPAPAIASSPTAGGPASEAPAGTATDVQPRNDYAVAYKNWSTFTATTREDGHDVLTFIFKRDGLWSWKLSGVTLPINFGR